MKKILNVVLSLFIIMFVVCTTSKFNINASSGLIPNNTEATQYTRKIKYDRIMLGEVFL